MYFIGDGGQDCDEVCQDHQMLCTGKIDTGNTANLFSDLGVTCKSNTRPWTYSLVSQFHTHTEIVAV